MSNADIERQQKLEAYQQQCGTPEAFEKYRVRNGIFRKPEDGLDDEWIDEYLAWKCSKRNPQIYLYLIENCTKSEVAQIFAMIRLDAYLDEEFATPG